MMRLKDRLKQKTLISVTRRKQLNCWAHCVLIPTMERGQLNCMSILCLYMLNCLKMISQRKY
ncbi:hypothetical protein FRX31_023835, partial [Thalictrum thalictroides]